MSLEQLLAEGRSRPTFSGTVAVPLDDIEELGAAELVESPSAVAVMEPEPAPVSAASGVADLEARVASLEQQLQAKKNALRAIARDLDALRERIRTEITD